MKLFSKELHIDEAANNARTGISLLLVLLLCFGMLLAFSGCRDSGASGGQQESALEEGDDSQDGNPGQEDDVSSGLTADLQADIDNGYLVLVNKAYAVTEDYAPGDLVHIDSHYAADREDVCRYMRPAAAEAFIRMADAAEAEGVNVVMTTAYRSYSYQNILWTNNVARKGSEEEANKTSARPNESEHRTGLAVDLSSSEINNQLSWDFADTAAGQWIAENCSDYGFILRYPEGKTEVTGYLYEPWHIRYVGDTAAREITDSGITLEEYLDQKGIEATTN